MLSPPRASPADRPPPDTKPQNDPTLPLLTSFGLPITWEACFATKSSSRSPAVRPTTNSLSRSPGTYLDFLTQQTDGVNQLDYPKSNMRIISSGSTDGRPVEL